MSTESVWDYPRPPRLEPTSRRLKIVHHGIVIAETMHGLRILETSHPPVYYFPPDGVRLEYLQASRKPATFCEFKGMAKYWNLTLPNAAVADAAWSYSQPVTAYAALKDYLAFYAHGVDECWVDDERVIPQEGSFYGGWITSDIRGPFKGGRGTMGW